MSIIKGFLYFDMVRYRYIDTMCCYMLPDCFPGHAICGLSDANINLVDSCTYMFIRLDFVLRVENVAGQSIIYTRF